MKPNISKKIKNIIFDFGGVICNIDHLIPEKKFKAMGIRDFDIMYSQAIQNNLFENLEKNLISPQVFRKNLKLLIGRNISDEQIDEAWNSIILDIPKSRIDLLKKLKNQYRIFLLSNSNIIHYNVFIEEFRLKSGLKDFSYLFEKTWFSFDLKMRKPDKEIYEFVLKDGNLKPEETLFIDDSIQNIKPAEDLGIKCVFLDGDMDILKLFDLQN
ncbi:MAG: HAD family phosphatase [Bacteroidales bacterium]|nr:HAD family phosphatase [Bacteroidales bacterium]